MWDEVQRYTSLMRGIFMTRLAYRFVLVCAFVTNLAFIILLYFLWKTIYGSSETLHGLTFNQTFIQLTLATAILGVIQGSSNRIAGQIRSGSIVLDLVRPLDFQIRMLAENIGSVLFALVSNTLPCTVIVIILARGDLPLGINLPVFVVSFVAAYLLNFTLEFFIGSLAFYTQSMWGLMASKEIITRFLSGALIPLAFFPQAFQSILLVLPFQAIVYTPLQILTNASLTPADYMRMLGIQLAWMIVLLIATRLFFRHAIKQLTINGG